MRRAGTVGGMGDLMTRAVLLAQGYDDDKIRKEVEKNELRRVWPGIYTRRKKGTPWQEYLLTVEAAVLAGDSGVLSHQSAAAVHDLPMLHPDYERVHTTIAESHGGGVISKRRHVHPRPFRPEDVVRIGGMELTSRARTPIDVGMAGTYEQALVVIDGARLVRRYPKPTDPSPTPLAQIQAALDYLGRRRGCRVVQRALNDSVTCSESAGESWSRARMIQWGLPMPVLQSPFRIAGRRYFADFHWGSLVGEFDGDGKYKSDESRLSYEKRRDSDFATLGITVCHWRWEDLEDRERFFQILTNAMVKNDVLPHVPKFPG